MAPGNEPERCRHRPVPTSLHRPAPARCTIVETTVGVKRDTLVSAQQALAFGLVHAIIELREGVPG